MRNFESLSRSEGSLETGEATRQAAQFVGRAVVTLFVTPPHHHIYRELKAETMARQEAIPLHASVDEEAGAVASRALPQVVSAGQPLSRAEQALTAGLLMQFGDHFQTLPSSLTIPYETVSELHHGIVERAAQSGRLSVADQLAVALEQQQGDLASALHTLLVSSRLYARWLDEKTCEHPPLFSWEDRKQLMRQWQDSLLGFKPGGDSYHDVAGDTYYAWTHAYAGYAFGALARTHRVESRLARSAFRHGTAIMQTLVNNLNPDGTISDHTIAARYGNMIADVCNQYVGEV